MVHLCLGKVEWMGMKNWEVGDAYDGMGFFFEN